MATNKGPRRQFTFPDALNQFLDKTDRHRSSLVTYAVQEFIDKYGLSDKSPEEIKSFVKMYQFIKSAGDEDISVLIKKYPFIRDLRTKDEINTFMKMYPFLSTPATDGGTEHRTYRLNDKEIPSAPEEEVVSSSEDITSNEENRLADGAVQSMQNILKMFNS